MNYPQSQEILDRIKTAQKILLALHRSPDEDSTGSNLAMLQVLEKMGKRVEIVSFDPQPLTLSFLPDFNRLKQEDITTKDVSGFDLFIALDSAGWQMLSRNYFAGLRKVTTIDIDHHITNSEFGNINLIDGKIGSTSEILYKVFKDWKVEIDRGIADCLLVGIVGDTGAFRYANATTPDTFRIAADLLEKGASLRDASFNLYQRIPLPTIKYWAKVLSKVEIKKIGKYNLAFVALSPDEVKAWRKIERQGVASQFLQSIEGTDLGLLVEQDEAGRVSGGLRDRTGVDVSKIALALGGGGHTAAAGFSFSSNGLTFQECVDCVLETVEKVLK